MACDCPRRKRHFQPDFPDLPRYIVSVTDMVYQILGCAPPDGSPRNGASPQLGQPQMAARHMPIHIALNDSATKRARRRMLLSVLHFSRLAHLLQFPLPPHHMVDHLCINSANSGMETCDSGKSPMSTIVTS